MWGHAAGCGACGRVGGSGRGSDLQHRQRHVVGVGWCGGRWQGVGACGRSRGMW